MKILIVENEIYLAQSIVNKLEDIGYSCEISTTIKGAIKQSGFDIILLSTNLNDYNIINFIEKNKDATIILLVSYITNDTVSRPLRAGASDYIQKPFMIEELIRKVNHHKDYKNLKSLTKTYEDFLDSHLNLKNTLDIELKNIKFPLALKVSQIKQSDSFVLKLIKSLNTNIALINCTGKNYIDKILKLPDEEIGYIKNFQVLKSIEKEKIKNMIKNKKFIISTTDFKDEFDFRYIEMPKIQSSFEQNTILTIDDYIKFIIVNFQKNFSDTELSKRLGISRKSLWEKRKKYEIARKK